MKKFKTEKIIYFNTKYLSKTKPNKLISNQKEKSVNNFICFKKKLFPTNFLAKKKGIP